MKAHIAIDIGASSGRLIYGHLEADQLVIEEIYRFENGFTRVDGHDYWAIDKLVNEILTGLETCKQQGITEATVGIDTWAVDYVLIGNDGQKLRNPISYRDDRTQQTIDKLTSKYSKAYIYEKTGIQFLNFNTLYQLYEEDRDLLDQTNKILLVPDYLGYVLTGKAVTEVTNASTTQMLNLKEGLFDSDLLAHLQLSADKFPPLVDAGTPLGNLRPELVAQYDLPDCQVITVATHDTASAVVGTPGQGQDWAFLSSGTWSLIGKELTIPENGSNAFEQNYTNEWGAYGTYRFLKNIMGLWMVQSIRHELDQDYSFAELAQLASQEPPFQQFINVNDDRFTNPVSMIHSIKDYCRETKQKVPQSVGELVNAIYSNLALDYANQIAILNRITQTKINNLHIVGGGSNVTFLNQLTSDLAGITVVAGPSEATAVGNLLVQMISTHELPSMAAGRDLLKRSFNLQTITPKNRYPQILTKYQQFINQQEDIIDEAHCTDHVS